MDVLTLLNENHGEFWATRLDLRMPKWKRLGKMLSCKRRTPQAQIKQAGGHMKKPDSLQSLLAAVTSRCTSFQLRYLIRPQSTSLAQALASVA